MNKVLVTGSEGFLGRSLVPELVLNGFEVHTLDVIPRKTSVPSSKHFQLDLSGHEVLNGLKKFKFDTIFHLAAQSSVLESIKNPISDLLSNIKGTVALLDLLTELEVGRFIYAQSGGAIYKSTDLLPISEDFELGPQSPYGLSKLAAEMYIKLICESKGIPWVSLAFSNIYGPVKENPKGVLFEFYRNLSNSTDVYINGPENTRDFLYVTDAVSALVLAASKGFNQRINISTGKETSLIQLFNEVRIAMGIVDSKPIISDAISGEVKKSSLDNSMAREIIGWVPKVGIKEGVQRSIS